MVITKGLPFFLFSLDRCFEVLLFMTPISRVFLAAKFFLFFFNSACEIHLREFFPLCKYRENLSIPILLPRIFLPVSFEDAKS